MMNKLPHLPAAITLSLMATFELLGTARAADTGRVKCEISDNSAAASGTLTLEAGGKAVASGACTAAGLPAPTGKYTAIVRLDGALDTPEQRQPVVVAAGKTTAVRAKFATGTLQIAIRQNGRRAAGVSTIRMRGKRIGSLASGVTGHLGAGHYEITVRYRNDEKALGVIEVKAGEHRSLNVDF